MRLKKQTMKVSATILLSILSLHLLKAQDCKAYVPQEVGTKAELTSYDKKGKKQSKVIQELTGVEDKDGGTYFAMHLQIFNDKDKLESETDAGYKCIDNTFYLDMNSFVNQEQMEAFKDMDVKVEMDEIDIPSSYSVGQKLKDGSIKMTFTGMPMAFTVTLENRKVEAEEEITTPAGSFNCVKISQDIVSKSIMSMTLHSVEWYAEGVGVVRNETYKKDKLMGYTELTALTK